MTSATTSQLEYHGVYVILIGSMALIVVALTIAAIREARRDRRARDRTGR